MTTTPTVHRSDTPPLGAIRPCADSAAGTEAHAPAKRLIQPTALPRDARVALVAPAGPLTDEAVDRAAARVEALGWTPLLGRNSRGRRGYLSGTDAERLADLQAAIDSDAVDAIWCLRGGYGTMRIVDRIDWDALLRRPRPLIGFSDNTALHLALQRRRLISFHGPHPGRRPCRKNRWRCCTASFPSPSRSESFHLPVHERRLSCRVPRRGG